MKQNYKTEIRNPQARQLWLSLVLTACSLFLLFSSFQSSAQTTLAQWTYEPLQGTSTAPTPNAGTYSLTATSSIVGAMSGPGTSPGSSLGCLQTTGTTAWAITTANPGTSNESSGAEFRFSTFGYENIKFSYDQRFSNTAVRTVRIQYTLDGTSWNNFTIDTLVNYTSGCSNRGAVDNGRIDIGTPVGTNVTDGWSRRNIDFSSITAANNNPNFGVRIVAAHYSTTGQFRQSNNVGTVATAGTWRFDNVTGTGTAIVTSIPSIVITTTGGGNAVAEGGATDTFMVALGAAPTADVVVTGTPNAQVNITPAVLTFTSSNWSIPQTVTVSAVDDNSTEGNHTGSISYTVSSTDLSYNNITVAPVSVSVTDNDLLHTVAFVRADTTVSESATSVKIWLRVATAGNTAGSVDLLISGASNATNNDDYSVTSNTLNIPANAVLNQIFSFDVTINDDANAESDEYIICKMNNAIGLNITTTGIQQHTLYIKDNDKAAPVASNQLNLSFVSSFNNGAAGTNSLEISAYDSASKRIFVANSISNKLDIINFANPSAPVLISSINLGVAPFNGAINSVDVFNGTVALALEGLTDKQSNGKVVFTDINGSYISEAAAGAMPDMITFNHAGTKVYTANEGEPNNAYTIDPVGSITVVDISGGVASPSATTIGFTAYNGQEATLRSQGIRIYGVTQPGSVPSTAEQDFEPEYITISDDDSKAWVTLQENNALVELDLTSNTIVKLIPLGYKDHSDVNNPFDVSDQTFGINLSNFNVKGMYEPDAITQYTSGGTLYLLTANEGDARAYSGFNEETRVNALTLDPTAYPNAAEIKNNAVSGRLTVTNKLGDTDNDGDIDQIYCLGGRSFSIWNPAAVSPLVYDSKDDIERITSTNATYSQFFNMSNTIANTNVKNRSDDKGPEPEGIAVGNIGGINYAFVSLERIGGVMIYDITNPASPTYVTYANSRAITGGDRGAEGIIFVPSSKSPNGKNLVLLSNEISSTLSVFEINPCAAPGIAAIANVGSTSICPGSFVKLYNTDNNATYTRQWLKDGVAIAGATDSVYNATTSGSYRLVAFNSTGCVDTSAAIAVIVTQPAQPTLACYETATFNTTSCAWDVTGTQPAQPTLACYETASFNTTSCAWDVTGTQPAQPTLACYETASFNTTSCAWDVTGTQPAQPTLACYETASFNTTSCAWDVTGTQPAQPSLACYETATFNTTSCAWDVTGTMPAQPTLACYETASFNTTSCAWDVTGTQPAQPSLACYETATFNTTSCAWDVTGTMPAQPTLACYETASFNTTSCAWDVTGTAPVVTASNSILCPNGSVTLVGTPAGGTFSVPNPYSGPATTYTYTAPGGCGSATGTVTISSVAPANIVTPITASATTATITWNAVPGSTIYYVWYKPVFAPASAWLTPTTSGTSLNLTGLIPNTPYEVKIRNNNAACNQFGVFGLPVNFTTLNDPCGTPTTVTAVVVPTNRLKFDWVALAGAAQYNIWFKNTTTNIQYTTTINAPATTFTTGVLPAGNYEYKIRNRCANVTGFTVFGLTQTIGVGNKGADLALTSSITMFPNPTTDVLNIELNAVEATNALVKVYDLTGRLMQTVQSNINVGVNQITLNMSEYAAGVYTVQVFENGTLTQVNRVRKND
jgi:hypothetical protein